MFRIRAGMFTSMNWSDYLIVFSVWFCKCHILNKVCAEMTVVHISTEKKAHISVEKVRNRRR